MADIFHDFVINAPVDKIFHCLTTPGGLDAWWTKKSSGKPVMGEEYKLWFGPEYHWRAIVSKCTSNEAFELQMAKADSDWAGTRVGFELETKEKTVQVRFYRAGWPRHSQHYRTSTYCWAMYLRILKRFLEHGEEVRYEDRLEV